MIIGGKAYPTVPEPIVDGILEVLSLNEGDRRNRAGHHRKEGIASEKECIGDKCLPWRKRIPARAIVGCSRVFHPRHVLLYRMACGDEGRQRSCPSAD